MSHHFDESQIEALRSTFDEIDSDKNGLLDQKELHTFFRATELDENFIPAIFRVFDTNSDGFLSFEEFTEYLSSIQNEEDPRAIYRLIFKAVDKDNSGGLDIEEILEFTSLCGIQMTREQVIAEMETMDKNLNGLIEFEELCLAIGI